MAPWFQRERRREPRRTWCSQRRYGSEELLFVGDCDDAVAENAAPPAVDEDPFAWPAQGAAVGWRVFSLKEDGDDLEWTPGLTVDEDRVSGSVRVRGMGGAAPSSDEWFDRGDEQLRFMAPGGGEDDVGA